MPSRIILIAQEKGGMRKTFLAVHLARFLQMRAINATPVDFDFTDGLMAKAFPPPKGYNISPDLNLLRRGDSLFPQLLADAIDGRSFIVDSGANTFSAWHYVLTEAWPSVLEEFKKAEVKVTILCPVSGVEKTHESASLYRAVFPDADLVLASVKEFRNQVVPLPAIKFEAQMEIPNCPPQLIAHYEREKIPIDDIAAGARPNLGISIAFARGLVPQLHAQFERILPFLLP